MKLRDYQQTAARDVWNHWDSGSLRVCLVMPTGGGKTATALEIVKGRRALWVTHRDELAQQLPEHIRVRTVQGLLARDERPPAEVVVLDEVHRYAADQWRTVAEHYRGVPTLGLTATPERADGRALGDLFDQLVAGAKYSELIDWGHLVECDVYRPSRYFEGGLALDPVAAWQRWGEGRLTFAYVGRVEDARTLAEKFAAAGVSAEVIDGGQNYGRRRDTLARFRAGQLRVLVNVHILTEGIDVPEASCILLGRNVGHVGTYLQIVGRGLRAAPGKTDARLIDLSGCSFIHGLPTQDREYSLEGTAIGGGSEAGPPALSVCERCGYTQESGLGPCGRCGYLAPPPKVKIWDVDLQRVYRGADTPARYRQAEWERLCAVCQLRDWGLAWAAREYGKLFGDAPAPKYSTDQKKAEFTRLRSIGQAKGYKPGWAAYRYRQTFGVWPRGVR